jgi:hypothetical protein
VVLLSAESQIPGSKEALAELCKLYWYPLYGHMRRYGFSAHDAQDLTQGFFLDLVEHNAAETREFLDLNQLPQSFSRRGRIFAFHLKLRLPNPCVSYRGQR